MYEYTDYQERIFDELERLTEEDEVIVSMKESKSEASEWFADLVKILYDKNNFDSIKLDHVMCELSDYFDKRIPDYQPNVVVKPSYEYFSLNNEIMNKIKQIGALV